MMEITLCGRCAGYGHKAADCQRQPVAQGLQRACADCLSYAPVSTMKTMGDGRVICKPCEKKARDKAGQRAQLGFFGQMDLI